MNSPRSRSRVSGVLRSTYQNVAQVAGDTAHHSQQFQPGETKATPMLLKGQSLAAFNPGGEGELQVQADTGQVWTFPDAFILSAPTMTDDGGKMPVTWNCSTYTELLK
ncbi:phage tail tube protein [Acetobacter syzygii]|uniref:phage tail tube protein n=1 Tax=Acetobacter syzygii TaxID=146476 RepID=UPI0039E97310